MRLDKAISSQGTLSRKEARALIKSGRVGVDGVPVTDPGAAVDPVTQRLSLDGQTFTFEEHVYLMLNKPAGYISATEDRSRPTVLDLVPEEYFRNGLFPAGRLDSDTTGFVLLTDDGAFAHDILSPKHHVYKTYRAELADPVDEGMLEQVRGGVALSDGTVCLPAEVTLLGDRLAELKIVEGKYHQVKRMWAAAGNRVVSLSRTAIGPVPLDPDLAPGECRPLTEEEVSALKARSALK